MKIVGLLYVVTLLGLFLYSFTQIDLGLVISRYPFFYQIEKTFQYIGYFNRPLSTLFYLLIVILLFVFYIFFLRMAAKKKLSAVFVWKLLFISIVIATFSYSAFSYDIFNYIFDAKIITHYAQNPYTHKALDYPADPMLSFMHWTHRMYPYGPMWLVLTVPLSWLGLQLFLPTFFLFKLLAAGSFLGSLFFIKKIIQKVAPGKEIFGLIFFGLNPLLLIEGLVTAHIDIVMLFFALWAFYLLVTKKYVLAFVLLAISIGIKFATVFLLPVFIYIWWQQKRKKIIPWKNVFLMAVALMIVTVIIATTRTNFQPWYFIGVLAFAVFIADKYYIFLPTIVLSLVALLHYVPFLYLGNWDPPVPGILTVLDIAGIVVALTITGGYYFLRRR